MLLYYYVRTFASIHLKFSIYFSIKTYFFSILHGNFSKTLTSDYLFYTLFYLNNNFSLIFIIILSFYFCHYLSIFFYILLISLISQTQILKPNKHRSPPQAPTHRFIFRRPTNVDLHHRSTNPFMLTHKR